MTKPHNRKAILFLMASLILMLPGLAYAAAPVISSFNPTSGAVGASVAINGTNFIGATSVTIGGVTAGTGKVTNTQIVTTVPAGAVTGVITVTTPSGTGTSASNFTVLPTPTITSFTPTTGAAGLGVTITGTNLTGATAVSFNGTAAVITGNTATQITTTVPVGATTGPISVTASGVILTSASTFTVIPGPTITSFTPTSGPVATSVTITGTNLTGATGVSFGGTPAITFTPVSATQVTATVPAGATTGQIAVTTPAGVANTALLTPSSFTVLAPPVITSFSPTIGPVGTVVTINGTNFTGATVVSFGGTPAITFTVTSATQITATVPAGAATGQIAVTTPIGTGNTATLTPSNYTVGALPPTITGLSPALIPAASAQFTLTVTGTGFVNGSVVNWNGSARATTFGSATQLTATILASDIAVPGTFPVTVTNPGPSTSNALSFTVTSPVPVISSMTPSSAPVNSPAFLLTVTGSNFDSGSQLFWNGSPRTLIAKGSTGLIAQILATDTPSPGLIPVTVSNASGLSLPSNFSVLASVGSTVLSISPATALPGSGPITLTVNGAGFVSGAAVYWNGSARTTTFVTSAQLTASISALDLQNTGLFAVSVINTPPDGTSSNSLQFLVGSPTITSISPTSGTVGDPGETLVVTGTNFINGAVVRWNGVARPTVYNSSTQLTATIPSTDVASAGTAQITVLNNPSGGGSPIISNAVQFTVNAVVPVITSLNPTNVPVNNGQFTLTVNGTGFDPTAIVYWNGSARATQYLGLTTQLTATILAGDTTVAGTALITVIGTAGTSAAFPLPVGFGLTSLSPSSANVGNATFFLTANGIGFVSGSSTICWNGSPRSTIFVSSTQVYTSIATSDISVAGTASVTVAQPGCTAPVSNALTFTINAVSLSITSITPTSATAGDPATTLNVNGTGFNNGSIVQWNGVSLSTTYLSSTYITATIPSSYLVSAGTAIVTVLNPGPLISNSVAFTINAPVGFITLNPTSLTFSVQSGGTAPAPQSVTVNNSVAGALNWNAAITFTTGGDWLGLGNLSGTAGTSFSVIITNTFLTAGTYSATVQVSSSGASNSPVSLSVTYIVSAPTNLTVSPLSLSFASATGGSPAAQSVTVSASTGSLNWTASSSTTSGGDWIVLSKISGTSPDTISVSVNTAGLAAGTYNGTITVSSSNAGNSPQRVSVTLTLGTPTIVLTPSFLTFSTSVNVNPGSQTFQVQNAKDGVLGWTATVTTKSGGSWLTVGPTSGTAPSTVTVSVNVSGLTAGAYAGSIVITAIPGSNATNSPQTLPVILAIDAPVVSPNGIVNGASFSKDAVVSPGSIASLFGSNLSSGTAAAGAPAGATTMTYSSKDGGAAATGLPTILNGTQVLVNGQPAGLFYVSPTQINFQMPPDVSGPIVQVVVVNKGVSALSTGAAVQPAAPGIFTATPGGTGPGAILNQDYAPNSASNPARTGSVILIYATGLGATTNPPGTGQFASALPLSETLTTPIVTVGGVQSQVQFSGLAPGFVGLYQVNVFVPSVAPGASVPVTLSMGGVPSNTVTVAVQ